MVALMAVLVYQLKAMQIKEYQYFMMALVALALALLFALSTALPP